MRLQQSIRFCLLRLGLLPAALIGLALTAYFTHVRINDAELGIERRAALIARQLAAASSYALASGDLALLHDMADAAINELAVVQVCVLDARGHAVVWRDNPRLSGGATLSRALEVYRHADAVAGPLGEVRMVLSQAMVSARQRETAASGLALLAVGLAAAWVLAVRMGRKISAPVLALTDAVHELSTGNLGVRVETDSSSPELHYLQAGFNAMSAELTRDRDALALQVQRATDELREALADLEVRNQEIESARAAAESQAELKSRFLAQMSHEIRTPMNGIIGFAELLAQTRMDESQAQMLGLIERSAKSLMGIINDILDLSKLEAGRISLDARAFDLRGCLEDIVALLSVRSGPVETVLWIESAVPRRIVSDAVRLQQVIANLLGNSLKFTRRGRIVLRVRVLDGPGGKRLLFSVSDSGPGIAEKDIARLFSPFLQLAESGVNAEGTGLGLSIAKNIVESLGGTIRIASRVGKGTSLWFALPLVEASADNLASRPVGRVGLMEPERMRRQAIRSQLQALGAQVEAADSPEGCFRWLASGGCPPVVIYRLLEGEDAEAQALRWLRECKAHHIKPVLLLPQNGQALAKFYRERGAACVCQPVASKALCKAISAEQRPARPRRAEAAAPKPAERRRVLVADDNDINRLLLRAQLEATDAEIVEARDGREALERLRRQAFDLALLDLQMPLMNGEEVLREARRRPGPNRSLPFIAVTAFSMPGQREAAMAEGFADCLIKPVAQQELLSLIGQYLPASAPSNAAGDAERHAAAIIEKTGGNLALAKVIAGKLFAESPELLAQAKTAMARGDFEAARQAVHKLNGSASFCGLEDLRVVAAALEAALAGGGKAPSMLAALWADLAREAEAFLALQADILGHIERQG